MERDWSQLSQRGILVVLATCILAWAVFYNVSSHHAKNNLAEEAARYKRALAMKTEDAEKAQQQAAQCSSDLAVAKLESVREHEKALSNKRALAAKTEDAE